jgi:phage-related minor tail protein
MVATIIAEFIRMQLIKAAVKGISKLFGVDASIFSADGNAFGGSGVVSVPTAHATATGQIGVLGESGPEAVMPLQRNAAGQLGIAAAPMGVTVNNYANADVGVRQTDQGIQIDVIRRQLADDVRRGGSTFASALEQTYRVGRQASAS